uniref:Ubiquitin-like protease family profile domain-containing protein n=1 Tax=Brassica oleracea var. oleracea TaxID=109376 RepID=A0A0D3BUW8_BRAOL
MEENYAYWEKLIGPDRDATIGDLVAMVLGDTGMSGSRKLRLCLIIIVDRVLVPTSQIQKPSLKHVNLVKNIKNFLAFHWGRESFAWAIRTMKPGPKVMGKCEDPNGDFCKKLRQKTLRILGFPLALQLVAFELIPQLPKQARGDDSTTLLTFPGQVLPQHAGLTVVHLRKAEHEAGLVVQPMMEISGTHDESWAAWDDEKYDKKVENMLGMIKSAYAFSKGDWGGGDGGDPIYKHGVKVNAKKRKGAAHIGVTEAPVLKQRHVSGYFRRGAMVDAEQYRRMEAHVQELVLEVQKLKNVVERQGRKFEKWKTFVKGKSSIKKQGSIKSRSRRRTLQGKEGTEENHDGAEGMEPPCGAEVVIETEDKVLLEDHVTVAGLGQVKKVDTETEEKADKSEGAGEKGEHLSEDEAGIAEEAEGAQGGDVIERERQDVLENVGAVCGQVEPNKVVVHAIEKEGKAEEKVENENDESDSQVEFCVHVGYSEDAEITGVGPNTTILDVSDTSDGGRTARHEPVQQEGEMAAVLLAKDQYITPDIVPTAEDCDYAYFERVLVADLKVMHTNAGGYDLDNEFFINLATPCKWVSSTHMDVLADYVGRLHGEALRRNRAMLVAPWFSAHLQVKERSFKAARRKTRIATDAKLTKFLTREGKKWGVDVDTLYAPMIWGGDHWVSLCIRLATWDILVFDRNPRLKTEDEVALMMEPVAGILPYLAKKVCPPQGVGEHALVPFHVERVVGLYENRRSGDCGPLAIKFLEMHATGNEEATMAGLTDDLVDIFRKQYAMEIYKDWVVPLYL